MIMSRRGVISLPIKLTVSLMIIALMVPPVSVFAENIHDDMRERELYEIAEDLKEVICYVYTKGPTYVTHFEMSIPDGCYLVIGGDQNMSIRMFYGMGRIGWVTMDVPIGTDETLLTGNVLLEISNEIDEIQKVAVREV